MVAAHARLSVGGGLPSTRPLAPITGNRAVHLGPCSPAQLQLLPTHAEQCRVAGVLRPRTGHLCCQALPSGPPRSSLADQPSDAPPPSEGATVVDLSRFFQPGGSALITPTAPEVAQIARAASGKGFLQVVGHNVDDDLMKEAVRLQQWLFALPDDVKGTIKRSNTNSRGWFNDEFTKQKLDWKECFDFGVEGRSDPIDGTNQWLSASALDNAADAADCQAFRHTMLRYFDAMTGLSAVLTQLLLVGLGMPPSYFDKDFDGHTSFMRLNYYPECHDPSQHLGISPHRDAGFLTVLAQHDVAGLQVYTGDEDGMDRDDPAWVTVPPVSGAFVINVGDMFEVLSNGRYRAPLHRVLANKESARFSAPFFYNPNHGCSFAPISGCVDEQHPPLFRPVIWGDFRRRRIEGDLSDVGKEVQIADYRI